MPRAGPARLPARTPSEAQAFLTRASPEGGPGGDWRLCSVTSTSINKQNSETLNVCQNDVKQRVYEEQGFVEIISRRIMLKTLSLEFEVRDFGVDEVIKYADFECFLLCAYFVGSI